MTDRLPWNAAEPGVGSVIDTLRIDTLGHLPARADQTDATFGFEGFGLVLSGRGRFQAGAGPVHVLEAPAVFFIWPGQRFRYGPDPGTTWDERYLCFTGRRVADWRRWHWLSRPLAPRPLLEPEALAQLHRRIAAAFGPRPACSLDEAKLEVERLVWRLHCEACVPGDRRDALDDLLESWRRHVTARADLRQAAASLGISYSGFRQKIRGRTGLGPYQYLLRLRIDEACRLLVAGDQAVKAVAFAAGFPAVESFCRAFRRMKRMTPTEYRARHRAMHPRPQPAGGTC